MIAVETIDTNAFKKVKSRILGNIPESWIKTTLGECFKWGSGGTPKSGNSEYYGGNIPWLVIGDLNDSIINASSQKITEKGLRNSCAKLVDEGTLLLAMYGSIGKLGIAGMKLATNQAIAFAEKNEIDTKYLFNFLLYVRLQLSALGKGATQQNISQTVIKAFPFPLAPLNEQKRIVAKIEELFSELDNGVAALKTARERLKVYRQAVLKHAFEGKLTAKWREENADKLESPEQLLARIQHEREARYQEQLEDWQAAVKEWEANGKKGKKPSKPRENQYDIKLDEDDRQKLPWLPDSWMWLPLNELISGIPRAMQSGPFGSNLKHSEFTTSGILVIGIDNVKDGYFTIGSENRISEEKFTELEKYEARPGDLLVTVMASLGRTCVVPRDIERAIITKHVYRISMEQHLLYPEFYNYLLQSHTVSRLRMLENAQGQTRPGLNSTILKELPVPLCHIDEQKLIVAYIKEKLNTIANFETEIENVLKRSDTLRQSILKKAFSGQLVPQDPSDEPASKLLARIQAEKEFINTQKHQKKNNKHSVSDH